MKTCTFFLLASLFVSCYPDPEQPIVLLSPKEEILLGTWQEIGPRIASHDSAGNFLDSIDINSVYTFKNDYTFTAVNEFWLNTTSGTWTFDTIGNKIALDPLLVTDTNLLAGQRNHVWIIHKLDSAVLQVYYEYEFFNPIDTGTVFFPRNFVKQ